MVPNLSPADPPLAAFFNIGQNIKEGLPFTPWAAELRKQRMASNSKENPDANCLPLGFMQLDTHSQPRKVVQNANDMVITYEANAGQRNIYTDGRALPSNDPQPWWYGYSVGTRWRHARGRDDRPAGRWLARRQRRTLYERREATERFRRRLTAGNRHHRRRRERTPVD
jgi:hypothetical protein